MQCPTTFWMDKFKARILRDKEDSRIKRYVFEKLSTKRFHATILSTVTVCAAESSRASQIGKKGCVILRHKVYTAQLLGKAFACTLIQSPIPRAYKSWITTEDRREKCHNQCAWRGVHDHKRAAFPLPSRSSESQPLTAVTARRRHLQGEEHCCSGTVATTLHTLRRGLPTARTATVLHLLLPERTLRISSP